MWVGNLGCIRVGLHVMCPRVQFWIRSFKIWYDSVLRLDLFAGYSVLEYAETVVLVEEDGVAEVVNRANLCMVMIGEIRRLESLGGLPTQDLIRRSYCTGEMDLGWEHSCFNRDVIKYLSLTLDLKWMFRNISGFCFPENGCGTYAKFEKVDGVCCIALMEGFNFHTVLSYIV